MFAKREREVSRWERRTKNTRGNKKKTKKKKKKKGLERKIVQGCAYRLMSGMATRLKKSDDQLFLSLPRLASATDLKKKIEQTKRTVREGGRSKA